MKNKLPILPATFKLFGESLVNSSTWTSVNEYPIDFANAFCSELNSVEISGNKRIRYSLMVTRDSIRPDDTGLAKYRYPRAKKAKDRMERFLDTVEKKG